MKIKITKKQYAERMDEVRDMVIEDFRKCFPKDTHLTDEDVWASWVLTMKVSWRINPFEVVARNSDDITFQSFIAAYRAHPALRFPYDTTGLKKRVETEEEVKYLLNKFRGQPEKVICPWCGDIVPADEPLHDCQA